MYFQFYFFLFLLILNYFIFKYFLINTNKFNKFKLNKTIGIRWGNSKKSHLGGIIFFLNISLFFFYFFFYEKLYDLSNINYDHKKNISLYLSLCVAFLSGLLDEVEVLPPRTKILLQSIAAGILIWGKNIIPFFDIFFIDCFITIFCIIYLVNIINMFDNIDLGLGPLLFLVIFFIFTQIYSYSDYFIIFIILSYLSGLIIFIKFNIYPSKIFMGDMGSFQSAILLCFLLIELFFVNSNTLTNKFSIYENFFIISLVIPIFIYDFFYVTLLRIKNKKNIFVGDTNHLNHKINVITKNPNITFWYLFLLNFFSILVSLYLLNKNFDSLYLFLIIILTHFINLLILRLILLNKISFMKFN